MNASPPNARGWRWKPVEIATLVVAFMIYWPLGLAVLVWKAWNDRQPTPQDLGQVAQALWSRAQTAFDGVFSTLTRAPHLAVHDDAPTGNAAFDAYVRVERERIDADRKKLDAEIAAFRAYLTEERANDRDVFERFRAGRGPRRG